MGDYGAQPVACPLCAGACAFWFEKNGYPHYRCPVCAHGFVFPLPDSDAIAAYYGTLSSGLSSDCSWSTEPRHKIALWRRLLKMVEAESGKGPLIDIGCGAGQFLQLADTAGWKDLTGVEISAKAVEMARATSSAIIKEGAWRDVSMPHEHFVCAALLDVLEHDPDPRALLTRIRAGLRPGGCLLITVPNIHGLSLRVYGCDAFAVIPPEHLAYYSALSLRRLLEGCGYEIVWCTTCDIYLKEWLRFLPGRASTEDRTNGARQRAHYERVYAHATGRVALWVIGLVNIALGVLGVGDQLVVIARRPPVPGQRLGARE